ncbi:hypothetical protein C8F04DRAFT_1252165 [Mycena alexandri]|uniref:BTB domain-containing protein n=1 Tax=Mycena alexandri TaxID=1745969 RepID=A0AAD6XA10_9AGAR|nr:hypothetical protein C8F04DRAFT_1252165 [Mycena alexandri]
MAQRSLNFYDIANGQHVFRVKNTLYKFDVVALSRNSEFFKNMFELSTATSSDLDPIVLPDNFFEWEFEIFALIAYGRPPAPDSQVWPKAGKASPLLLRLLELSRFLMSPPTRTMALNLIKARSFTFPPALLIHLSFEYGTKVLFIAAFHRLASSPLRDLTADDVNNIGMEVFVALAKVKELTQRHRHVVAAEEPIIEAHSSMCANNLACERDWHGVWWNGMGRFLLDGRNALSWTESVERFEAVEFGEMDADCRAKMLKLTRTGDAYAHSYNWITSVAETLMGGIAEELGDLRLGL